MPLPLWLAGGAAALAVLILAVVLVVGQLGGERRVAKTGSADPRTESPAKPEKLEAGPAPNSHPMAGPDKTPAVKRPPVRHVGEDQNRDESITGLEIGRPLPQATPRPFSDAVVQATFMPPEPWVIVDFVIAPDATRVAALLRDLQAPVANPRSRVIVWDFSTGASRQLGDDFVGPAAPFSLNYTPDGRYVFATGKYDAVAIDVASARKVASFPAEGHWIIQAMALSADGTRMALCQSGGPGYSQGQIVLWDVRAGRRIRSWPFREREEPANRAEFSPDGLLLASVSRGASPTIWEVSSGRRVHDLPGKGATFILWVRFSPDGNRLVAPDIRGLATTWDVASGQMSTELHGIPSIREGEYSPDGKTLATATLGGVRLWDAASGNLRIERLASDNHPADIVHFSRDGRLLASGGYRSAKREKDYPSLIRVFRALEQAPAAAQLAIVELPTGPRSNLAGHRGHPGDMRFLADGSQLLCVDQWGDVCYCDVATRVAVKKLHAPSDRREGAFGRLQCTDDGRYVAVSGALEKGPYLWEVASDRRLQLPVESGETLWTITMHPTKPVLAGGSRMIVVWDAATGRKIGQFEPPERGLRNYYHLAFTRHGETLLAASGNLLEFWALDGRRQAILDTQARDIKSIALTSDGKTVATGHFDGTIKLWSFSERTELTSWHASKHPIDFLAFSPRGKMLYAASRHEMPRVWEAASGRRIHAVEGEGGVDCLAVSPRGDLWAFGRPGGVHLRTVPKQD